MYSVWKCHGGPSIANQVIRTALASRGSGWFAWFDSMTLGPSYYCTEYDIHSCWFAVLFIVAVAIIIMIIE